MILSERGVDRDNERLHCMTVLETYGAFGGSLWGIITALTDLSSHPYARGDYDPWRRPNPQRDFILSLAFAAQRGNFAMLRGAHTRRLENRAGGRYATGARR